jgi:hypothetical protein
MRIAESGVKRPRNLLCDVERKSQKLGASARLEQKLLGH